MHAGHRQTLAVARFATGESHRYNMLKVSCRRDQGNGSRQLGAVLLQQM